MATESLSHLNRDLLAEILSRVDGLSLASAACVCTDLRGVAKEKTLWQDLCHATWPSTKEERAQILASSIPGGFTKFYSDALPLLLYKPYQDCPQAKIHASPSEIVSLVDVYYKRNCVLSRVVYGVPLYDPRNWSLDCPFMLQVLGGGGEMGTLQSIPFVVEGEGGVGELCRKLEEDVRLSWVVLDVKNGQAVNLSSWMPMSVQRNWPSDGDVIVRFGSVVPVEKQLLSCGAAECVITVRCWCSGNEGDERLRWMEIGMQVEDVEGAHLNGHKSLMVLQRALGCITRSRDHGVVEEGYRMYARERKATREKKMRREGMADRMCAFGGVAVFAFFCFSAYSMVM